MKKQNMQDERISAQRRKINSEAFGILMLALLVSISVQQFILDVPFAQYAAEFICFFGMSLYMIVRFLMLGLNIYGDTRRSKVLPFVSCIVTGITVTVINGIRNYSQYADHYNEDGIGYFIAVLGITFVSATAAAFIILMFVAYLNAKKQAKISKQLDEDENDE